MQTEHEFLNAIISEFDQVYEDSEWEWDVMVSHARNVEDMARERLAQLKGAK